MVHSTLAQIRKRGRRYHPKHIAIVHLLYKAALRNAATKLRGRCDGALRKVQTLRSSQRYGTIC